MTVSEKIFGFLKENEIEDVDFYKSIEISKQQWYQISVGKSNFTVEMIKRIKKKYPILDLNKLLGDDQDNFMLMEPSANYDINPLKKDLKKAISLLQKHI